MILPDTYIHSLLTRQAMPFQFAYIRDPRV